MSRKIIFKVLQWGSAALCLAVFLFSGGVASQSSGVVGSIFREVAAVCRDESSQWMLVVCLAVYLGFFLFLERRQFRHLIRPADTFSPVEAEKENVSTPHPNPLPVRGGEGGAWLLVFVVICLAGYAWHYSAAVKSLQVLVLLAGIVFGKGMAAWAGWETKRHLTPTLFPNEAEREKARHLIRPTDTFSPVEAEKEAARHLTPALSPVDPPSSDFGGTGAEREKKANGIIFILLALLAGAALWQPETSPTFFYHGIQRWCGVWENPNLYGLLMGVGVVLGLGIFFRAATSNIQHRTPNIEFKNVASRLAGLVAAAVCGYGLYKSYSRGAWLGTAVGLIYLFWKQTHLSPALKTKHLIRPAATFSRSDAEKDGRGGEGEFRSRVSRISRLKNYRASLVIIFISLAVLAFWQLRFSELAPVQRLASVSNPNDFSWRNRVTAWQGAGRMMWDRPLAGFGWGEAETSYGKNYCPTPESAAIEMNDYLVLGISAGVPVMVCFLVYVFLGLRPKQETGGTRCPTVICRAGAAVLLVGFWFDGGLFKLPVAAVFWTLLELGRLDSCGFLPTAMRQHFGDTPRLFAKPNHWLRGLAVVLALAAAGLTAIHWVTPRLAVSERTLAIARKFLVHPKAINNFELLAAQPIWRGVKLKTLLEHAELATYNRALVNWPVEEKMFQEFVLSPVITGEPNESLNWRRKNWEEFYPRIRHESSAEEAAKIIVRHLHDRVTVAVLSNPPHEMPDILLKQVTDEIGFEIIYVAALRSVGIPARLQAGSRVEFWADNQWHTAPSPAVEQLP